MVSRQKIVLDASVLGLSLAEYVRSLSVPTLSWSLREKDL